MDNNTTHRRRTFDFIQANPGLTSHAIAVATGRGDQVTHVSAMLHQLRRRGALQHGPRVVVDSHALVTWRCAMPEFPQRGERKPCPRYRSSSSIVYEWLRRQNGQIGSSQEFRAQHPRYTVNAVYQAMARLNDIGAIRRVRIGYYQVTDRKITVDGRGMNKNSLDVLERENDRRTSSKRKIVTPKATTTLEQCFGWFQRPQVANLSVADESPAML